MKTVGSIVYVHRSALNQLNKEQKKLYSSAERIFRGKMGIEKFLNIKVIKVDVAKNRVSFIESDDFDTAREPQVGDAYMMEIVKGSINSTKIKKISAKGQIYHHKHLFVNEDYKGFNVKESKKWSKKWEAAIPKNEKKYIGYKKNWEAILEKYGLQ